MTGARLSSQERILEEMRLLGDSHPRGMTNKELAAALGASGSAVSRDMALFDAAGYVARDGRGRLRLSPEFGGIAGRIMKSYKRARLDPP